MILIKNKHSSNCCSIHWIILISDKYSIILTYIFTYISKHWKLYRFTESTFRSWCVYPS
jgi:hypothetical protein